jgi:hypothetical protein
MRILFILSFLTFSLFACKNKPAKETEKKEEPTIAPDSTLIKQVRDSTLQGLTTEVLTAFKNKDYESLALLIHPEDGVRFSPYAYIDTATDKVVSAAWIKKQAGKKQDKILWGTIDPTDEPINRTIDDYAKRFVYDADFLHPEKLKVNEFIGGGNTTNNLLSFYKGCDFTESHFSGFEEKYDGMDWRSLRLVFKKKDAKYFLVGVIHDEWTT